MCASFDFPQGARELGNELCARAMEPRFDRSDRNPLHLRDQIERLVVNLCQDNHPPLVLGELGDCVLQFAPELALFERLVNGLLIRDIIGLIEGNQAEPRAAPLLQQRPMRHGENPHRKPGRASHLKLGQHAENLRE